MALRQTFIDQDWQIHSLAVDFVPSKGKHTGLDIAKIFAGALDRAGLLDKIGGVTVDNASVMTTFMHEFETVLSARHVEFNADQ